MTRLAIVGSGNLDIVVAADRAPRAGETVLGNGYGEFPGGKGVNQSLSAAPHATTVLICALGADTAGRRLEATLAEAGATVDAMRVGVPTGRALIVLAEGDNRIVVAPGANAELSPAHVRSSLDQHSPTVVSAMLEVPTAAVSAAAGWAASRGSRFVLNVSPTPAQMSEDVAALLSSADPIIVNHGEAAALLDVPHGTAHDLAGSLAAFAASVVVTDGARGSFLADASGIRHVPAASVAVADTTGGGDALAGTLAAALATGADLIEALRAATDAATRLISSSRADRDTR